MMSVRKDSLPQNILRTLSAGFGVRISELTALEAFENFVYAFRSEGVDKILRISHCSHRSREALQAELDWIQFMRGSGARIAAFVPTLEGDFILESPDGRYLAVALEKVKGVPVHLPQSSHLWRPELYREWGRTVGEFHRLSSRYTPSSKVPARMHWDEDPYVRDWEAMAASEGADLQTVWRELQSQFDEAERCVENYGLIHGDLHAKNFFWNQGHLEVFDTDDCLYNWFVADIACILTSLALSPRSEPDSKTFVKQFLYHFGAGYSQEFSLAAEEIRRLPLFLRHRELVVLGALCHKWDFSRLSEAQDALIRRLRGTGGRRRALVDLTEQQWLEAFTGRAEPHSSS